MAFGAAPDNKETVYQTRSLSKWFAIGSILLLVSVIWASIQDYARPWKGYQRQYQALVENSALHQMDRVRKMMDAAAVKGKLENLEVEIQKVEKEMNLPTLIKEVEAGIEKREGEYYKVNRKYQDAKAEFDALHYRVEHSTLSHPIEAAKLKKELEKEEPKVELLRIDEEKYRNALQELKDRRTDILKKKTGLEDQLAKLNKSKSILQKQIDQNANSLGNIVRNAPVVDFIAPTIKINQVILDGLYDDYFFNKVARVDRCMSCHVTADQPGFEKYPQPFKTHPKLDLMVSADSPHPYEKIGCTTCHAGVPQSVDFNLAAHTPKDPIQAAEWEEQYGFHYKHDIKTPMVPLAMVEGKCVQCHAKEVYLKGAPTFNAGMRLIEQFGCFGCHKFTGHFEQLAKERKPGPPLTRLMGKLDPVWVRKWMLDPKSFRPTATMPNFWKTHNNSDPESLQRGYVEIDAIAQYLYSLSENYEPINPPGVNASGVDAAAKNARVAAAVGNAETGKKLVGSLGCLGCHAVADFPRKEIPEGEIGHIDPRLPMFGPELNQMGSKVSADWLYSWVINPRHYAPNGNMPSLKLQPQEAKDITAYLLTKHNESFEKAVFPEPNPTVRDAVAFEFMKAEKPTPEALETVAKMSVPDKQIYLGKKLVSHYGCYACHAIKGFEDAPKIGAELSFHGSKEVTKFSFENVHIPHSSREAWIFTKVRTPRIWDIGKVRDFQAKARMPHFGFTSEQANAITAIVIGQESKKVDDEQMRKVDGRLEQIIAGQRVLHRYNCIGCHAIDGEGGGILGQYADTSEGPPLLNTQGRKTQPGWLFSFLKNTNVMIRPWVKVRMPQFSMSDEDARILTKYFAARDGGQYPFVSYQADPLSSAEVSEVERLIKAQGCLTCHAVRKPGEDVAAAAPHFQNIKARLNGEWVVDWIHDPNKIMPGTRMPQLWPPVNPDDPKSGVIPVPGFFKDDGETQIRKVRDYLFQIPAPAEVPPKPEKLPTSTVQAR